jgi:hypothetical protein
MINGVATAVVSEVKDPANLGRVQIHLSAHAGGAKEWARIVSRLKMEVEMLLDARERISGGQGDDFVDCHAGDWDQ